MNDKIFNMSFSKIYPLLLNKALKKGRTKAEVDEKFLEVKKRSYL